MNDFIKVFKRFTNSLSDRGKWQISISIYLQPVMLLPHSSNDKLRKNIPVLCFVRHDHKQKSQMAVEDSPNVMGV